MRKITTLLMAGVFALSLSMAHAVDLDVKGGITYPKDPEQIGLDFGLSFNIPLVPMNNDGGVGVYLGINPNFTWVSWDKAQESTTTSGGLTTTKKDEFSFMLFPTMVNLELRFPVFLGSMRASAVYLGAGAGYAIGMYDYKNFDGTTTGDGSFGGLAAQIYAGMAFNINNNVYLLADVGYRYADVKGDYDLTTGTSTVSYTDQSYDLSGITAHIGVRFAFGGSSF